MRVGERLSRFVITVGGIGTIVAVGLIMVFLVAVVVPLFDGAEVEAAGEVGLGTGGPELAELAVDDYRVLTASVTRAGTLRVQRLDNGELLREEELFEGAEPTCQAWSVDGRGAVYGFADGSARLASFRFEPEWLSSEPSSEELQGLKDGEVATSGDGVVQRTPEGVLRRQSLRYGVQEPVQVSESPLVRVDQSSGDGRTVLCALDADGKLHLLELTERKNLLTGKITYRSQRFELAFEPPGSLNPVPDHLLLSGLGDQVLAVWEGGEVVRIDARDREATALAEVLDLVPEEGERITALRFLLGKGTLVVGDSLGRVGGWFTTKPEDADTVDGALLTRVHELAGDGAPVTSIGPSPRSRALAVGYADGRVRLFQMTGEKELATVEVAPGQPLTALELFPKEDGFACLAGTQLYRFGMDPGHPETTLRSLFTPVWYEGYPGPEHAWQSSSATDDFEPKLGLVPLIFGTLKATFYSLLFGAPIALLAAIYTSEFMTRRYRTPVKSTIEIMASLPSVVLGFLAALVIAPYVQRYLPAALAVFLTLPLSLLVGAYLWQMLPRHLSLRLEGLPRLVAIGGALVLSVLFAVVVGPLVERSLFAGDLELWLDGQVGSSIGGWVFLLLPLSALIMALLNGAFLGPWFRIKTAGWGHGACAQASFLKFAAGFLLTVLLAVAMGVGLNAAGLDPRADLFGILGTYVQRNALVVGFVMGFAVIPIIYTLAEDALSSVPEHLRLASLGAGATQWQTAVRVVVPTAMSGLFSALMIGLGRAVGETMIVLMATGNTPVMDLNIFNGFRTLSANIAVELPEAAQGSTHYRTLFLAALVLFAMTFLLNTLAELVRQRFRRRFHNL